VAVDRLVVGERQDDVEPRLERVIGEVAAGEVDVLDAEAKRSRGVRFESLSSAPSGEQLALLAAHAGRKKLRPHVQTIFPLVDAARAQEESRGGHVRGKLVLAL
jgi:NADPH:quinone reductase-like Zn-dependent oxidoreductase